MERKGVTVLNLTVKSPNSFNTREHVLNHDACLIILINVNVCYFFTVDPHSLST